MEIDPYNIDKIESKRREADRKKLIIELTDDQRYEFRLKSIRDFIKNKEKLSSALDNLLFIFKEQKYDMCKRIKVLNDCLFFSDEREAIRQVNKLFSKHVVTGTLSFSKTYKRSTYFDPNKETVFSE